MYMAYTTLIIGGGVAGLSHAIATKKAGGDPVVYEARDRSADGRGVYLTLAVNALDALQAIDVDTSELGFDTPLITMTSGSGRRLGVLPYGRSGGASGDGGDGAGFASRTVKRADLHRVLRDRAVALGVRIEYGKRIAHAHRDGDRVVAAFEDGTRAEGDLLVGADGLRSRTRTIIAPDAPGARYRGLLNTGGYARGIRVDSAPGMMNAVFGSRCFFAYTVHPDGEIWWVANPPYPVEPTAADLRAMTPEDWRARLTHLLRGDQGPAAAIVAATDEIFAGWNTYDLPAIPFWHRDRMIIIGDAAHATSPSIGQGAAMAIEDAVVLAQCVRDIAPIGDAFAAYERIRRARVERVVEQGRRTGGWKALPAWASWPRDLVMRLGMAQMARTGDDPSQWIYAHHVEWDERVGAA